MARISLKVNQQCPICDGTEILLVKEALQHTDWPLGEALPVVKVKLKAENHSARPIGAYAVYVCAGCGFAEWFASNLAELKALAQASEQDELEVVGGLTLLRAGPSSPYR